MKCSYNERWYIEHFEEDEPEIGIYDAKKEKWIDIYDVIKDKVSTEDREEIENYNEAIFNYAKENNIGYRTYIIELKNLDIMTEYVDSRFIETNFKLISIK